MDEAMARTARKRIARAFATALRNAGMTILELHVRTRISRSALYSIDRAQMFPSVRALLTIAEALGVTAGELLDGKVAPRERTATTTGRLQD